MKFVLFFLFRFNFFYLRIMGYKSCNYKLRFFFLIFNMTLIGFRSQSYFRMIYCNDFNHNNQHISAMLNTQKFYFLGFF